MGSMQEGMDQLEHLSGSVSSYAFRYEEIPLSLTVTIGAACYEKNDTVENWVNRADRKLYEGKSSGKNKLVA